MVNDAKVFEILLQEKEKMQVTDVILKTAFNTTRWQSSVVPLLIFRYLVDVMVVFCRQQ